MYCVKDNISMQILSEEKIELIYSNVLQLLSETGVKIEDEATNKMLIQMGATLEGDNIVKIPTYMVEKALKGAQKCVRLYNRDGKLAMELEKNNIYFGGSAYLLKCRNPFTNIEEDFTDEHVVLCSKVVDGLDNIDFLAVGPMAKPTVNEKISSQVAFAIAIQNTNKVINFNVNGQDYDSINDIIDLATEICGGEKEFREKPFIFYQCDPISPRLFTADICKKLAICAIRGVPICFTPYNMMGGTAPMSFTGSIVQNMAEIFTGLIIHQAYGRGSPYIIGAMPSTMDLKTTIGTYSAPEFHMCIAACSEIAKYFQIPFYGTAGCTDSMHLDLQTMMESTMTIMAAMLSGANLIHDVGYMYHGTTICPELEVISDEIIGLVKTYRDGLNIDNIDSVLEDILKDDNILNINEQLNTIVDNRDFEVDARKKAQILMSDYKPNAPTANKLEIINKTIELWKERVK